MIYIKTQYKPQSTNINVIMDIEQYKHNSIFFCEPIKNNIMTEGNFIRIIYSINLFTINGIYIKLPIENIQVDKYYNKYKYIFDKHAYASVIEKIKFIEEDILKKVNIPKLPQYKIYEQLNSGHVKLITEPKNNSTPNILLKISGVWETDTEYGITYKFIQNSN